MVSVPMETDPGGLVGVLNVHTVTRRDFAPGDIELLRVIGRLIAGAMHQARLHRQLVARERAHELFVEQVIEAQEIERRRLAGDIHDGISQRLVTLAYRLDAAARAVGNDPDEASQQLEAARELARLTLQETRVAISGLRPPVLDDLGLSGGLASLAQSIPQLKIELDLAEIRLPEHIELALYRIAQEGLQNVVKHAAATTVRLGFTVTTDPAVARLEIVDDGVGFDTFEHPVGGDDMGGYGVLSMAERAELVGGRLNIRSRPGAGTAVTATIPVPSPAARECVPGRHTGLNTRDYAPSRPETQPRNARQKSPALRRNVSIADDSRRDSCVDIPMSENTSLLRLAVASATVERPASVIDTSVVRGRRCGSRSTRPAASSRRIACVTLVTWTCSRSDALVIGSAPDRLNASNRSNSNREKLRS
ncbi:hypothetical protein MSEN_00020 [Mycolicibacter senuensis]|uniref:histidine kinase n=1 Tax=Mycolicibacter senuensis TaxID=386913 RepID=A0A7I9XE69_9MYCO|nr:hypothetical protein MSEN_00020 [Mycolicibacter senuensis]